MNLSTLIEPKFLLIFLVVVFSLFYYYYMEKPIIFIIASVLIISIYIYFMIKESKETFIETPRYNPSPGELDVHTSNEKIKDPEMKTKIFNDTAKFMWDRSDAIKNLDPRAPNNDPPDTNAFAEWCYGLQPKTIIDNPSGNISVQIQDTCKSGSIYMNQPEKSTFDRFTCKGSW